MRYRGLVAGALISLTLAAVTSLALPLAVRRMIDHGFTQSDGRFINSYFAMLMVMAVVRAPARSDCRLRSPSSAASRAVSRRFSIFTARRRGAQGRIRPS